MMRSESTSALGHPRLTNPTFGWRRLMGGRYGTGGFPLRNPPAKPHALTLQMPHFSGDLEVVMAARTERGPYGALGRIGIVAGMHVAVLYVIARSLGIAPPLEIVRTEATFIPETVRPEDPLPRTDPEVVRPEIPPLVPPEVPPIEQEVPPPVITGEFVPLDQIPVAQPGSAVPVPQIVPPQVDPRRPLSRPPYPPEAIRAGSAGNIVVEIYVLPNGRVGDARVVKSTGFESLDRATLAEAKRNWRLKPATRDGQAIAEWHRLSVVFRLEDR